jgi:pyrroloquinoline-quinone synthase
MSNRIAAFEQHYSWVQPWGFDYFRRRVTQARIDSAEGLELTLTHCNTVEMQHEAVQALKFKCDVLWSILDSIQTDSNHTPKS